MGGHTSATLGIFPGGENSCPSRAEPWTRTSALDAPRAAWYSQGMSYKPARTVYQFPISHYSEKTRWCLDAKGLVYTTKDLVPGLHAMVARRLSGTQTVPILADRGQVMGDSSAIALYLDRAYPDLPLLPRDEQARARALELEDYFDEQVGQSMKRWFYGELMASARGRAAAAVFEQYPLPVRILGKLIAPGLERVLRTRERITPESIEQARATLLEAADRLEREIGGDPSRYLVGDALTLADITAASLFAPLVAPPGSPYTRSPNDLPPRIEELRRALRERPAGRWVTERYRFDRKAGAGRAKAEARAT